MELTFEMGWKVAEGLLAIGAAAAGFVFRAYAKGQRSLVEAHDRLKVDLHEQDKRLTATEASLHATKNNVIGIKEDLQNMRDEIRGDLRSFMETITGRIDNIVSGPPRRK